jgi:hypothetical protein
MAAVNISDENVTSDQVVTYFRRRCVKPVKLARLPAIAIIGANTSGRSPVGLPRFRGRVGNWSGDSCLTFFRIERVNGI